MEHDSSDKGDNTIPMLETFEELRVFNQRLGDKETGEAERVHPFPFFGS